MMKKFKVCTLVVLAALVLSACGNPKPTENPEPELKIGKGHLAKEIVDDLLEVVPDLPTGILVMVDNQAQARPQMGIDKADVVYEIMAEGGITRYMALFYTEKAETIGPVRSARYYFVQLAKGMDLPYAHVGGSVDALALIGELKLKDINEISNAQKYFWQDSQRKRPHSTYTSTDKLVEAITNKQYTYKAPDLPPIAADFSGDSVVSGKIALRYATGKNGYQAQWQWEKSSEDGSERYQRYINGTKQLTADGKNLVADTIYVITARTRARNTDPVTSSVDIVGSGEALCFVENKIIKGNWEKKSPQDPLVIKDKEGKVLPRKAGKTWVQVVDSLEDVKLDW